MNPRAMGPWIKRTYDRIIASVVLVVLLVSLVMLAVQAQLLKGRQQEFDDNLKRLEPRHPEAQLIDKTPFAEARKAFENPPQAGEWKHRLLIPELRVSCVNCDRPIPETATNCFYCKAVQPEKVPGSEKDTDKDGIPDDWELAHKFNPLNSEDARADADKDGFTNLDEFRFKTDPWNGEVYPPPPAKIQVGRITPIPFMLIFKSVNKIEGKVLYQINLRKGGRTYWAALGDTIEGFKVVAYDEKAAEGATLTVERGGKQIPLVKGKVVPRSEYEVTLEAPFPGFPMTVRGDSEFAVKGIKYQVKKVDTDTSRILIHDPSRDMDVWIGGDAPKAPVAEPVKDGV